MENYYVVDGKEEEDDDMKNGELRLYIYIYVFHFFPLIKRVF